jgi:NDP-sugar pyrophosphorylase family protein
MGGGVVSVDRIREYCNQNGLSVSDMSTKIDSVVDAVICEGESSSIKDGVLGIQYYKLDRPASEVEEYSVANLAAVATLDLLVDSGEYKKYYTDMSSGVLYYIFNRNSLMIVYTKDEKNAKDFLLGLGYPDDKWETETTNSGEKTDDIGKNGEQESDPLITRRDTARRNDLSRLDTSLVQYQTNNLGALPTGPSYWKGVATIECESGDVACSFVRDYLNISYSNNEIKNEFMDPGGTPYSLYITENWVDNESVTPTFGNTNSFLVVNGDGYTIGGDSPFSEHVIYVIPGGVCSEDTIVKSTNARQFGILYMLESGTINCLDDR